MKTNNLSHEISQNQKNPKVDEYIKAAKKWQEEFSRLREIVLDCGLTEDFKWKVPCYTLEDSNVVLIHGFKEYCAILFVKGALLHDPNGILVQQTVNVQAARQVRFTSTQEINGMTNILKTYILEAVEIEKSGLAVELKKNIDFPIPEALQQKFDDIPQLKNAFVGLTPGRQRAYILYFSEPKQSSTREARVEKYLQHILAGKGLHD